MSARVLVVEDEPTLMQAVAYALRREGFEVTTAGDGERALELFEDEGCDLIVLDLMLPNVSGLDVCRQVRSTSAVPIVMLTAKDTELDVVLGLEVGADDYMTKPFSMAELVGRIRANLRRRELDRDQLETETAVRTLGGVRIDLARHEVTVDGRRVALTPSELRLLHLLADRPQQVYSRRQIMEHLWDSSFVGDEHACDVHISNLRRKVERDPRHPERIVTVRGFGYKLVPV
jgi:two-component system, OmpR family, response regulator RegX3